MRVLPIRNLLALFVWCGCLHMLYHDNSRLLLFQYYSRARLLALHYLHPDKYEKPSLADEAVSVVNG